ncbi:hypothetical protein [Glaesserella sp.]|uniref:hypothetical protein n=1 Tax=Glaesserella sp. TaxID=2094731 RepID=UPI0035A045B2
MGHEWLKPVLAKGFAILLTLRLKNSPTEDMIKPTLETWFQVVTFKRGWEQEFDQVRFEQAFMHLAQTCEWFPAPKQLLEAMPARKIRALPPPPPISDEQKAKSAARWAELRKKLRGIYAK